MEKIVAENYKIAWLGFNEKPNYNSVWGHIQMHDSRDYVFWGIKDKQLMFKQHGSYSYKIPFLIAQKEKKGFKKIDPDHFEMISPNFKEELEIWLMAHILQEE